MLRNPRRYLLENSNRAEVIRSRISAVASHLDFDPMRVAQWGFVLAVLAAVWAAEDGEGEVEMDRWLAIAVTIREAGQG
jgi:streptomycin 6-kinase